MIRYRVADIIPAACEVFEVSRRLLLSEARSKHIVLARQAVIYLARELTDVSFPQIGRMLNRDHSTVVYSYHVAKKRMQDDAEYARLVDKAQIFALTPALIRTNAIERATEQQAKEAATRTALLADLAYHICENDDDALSMAVRAHYAAGKDCIEVY